MLVSFGDDEQVYYGNVVEVGSESLSKYKVKVVQPAKYAGQIKEVYYDALVFAEPSTDPKNWICITNNLICGPLKVSVKGYVITIYDSRYKNSKNNLGRRIGSFLPSGGFDYFDEFAKKGYLIAELPEDGLTHPILQDFVAGRKVKCQKYFNVFAEILGNTYIGERE